MVSIDYAEWMGRSVRIGGQTDSKGPWLTQWLRQCGSKLRGYALPSPSTDAFLYETADTDAVPAATIRDYQKART